VGAGYGMALVPRVAALVVHECVQVVGDRVVVGLGDGAVARRRTRHSVGLGAAVGVERADARYLDRPLLGEVFLVSNERVAGVVGRAVGPGDGVVACRCARQGVDNRLVGRGQLGEAGYFDRALLYVVLFVGGEPLHGAGADVGADDGAVAS